MRELRKSLIFVGMGAILATCGLLLFSAQAENQSAAREWLQPANPTKLDWAILDLQANFRSETFSEKGLAASFRTGPESMEKGVIHCDIAHLPTTSTARVQGEERRIGELFEQRRNLFYPWATLKFHSSKAKQFTSNLVFRKHVHILPKEKDRYGRLVARVRVDDTDVSLELVKAGLAWHYKKYSSDPALAGAEQQARAEGVGVWSLADPIPPWELKQGEGGTWARAVAETLSESKFTHQKLITEGDLWHP